MQSHIAVIICTWNRAAMLGETLQSLARVRPPVTAQLEVLIVDNNSNDGTQSLIQSLVTTWSLGRLHAVFEPKQGKQFALNAGIAEAKRLGCRVLAFTDDDVLFSEDWLEQIAICMGKASAAALIGGRTVATWPGGQPPVWYHSTMAAVVADVDLGNARLDPPPGEYAPAGANLIATADLFERIGGFSETHFRHMDYEFGQRALRRGEHVAYEPALLITAPVDPSIITQRYFRRWSFKAGISPWKDIDKTVTHFAGVPLWLYRRTLQDALSWLLAPLRAVPPNKRFACEFRLWRAWGTMSSRWMSRLRPEAYPVWAEGRAQKRKNVY